MSHTPTKAEEIRLVEIPSTRNDSDRKIVVNRSIEFPAEYHQAGLGILNYFSTVLREKCPDEKAVVKIEQDGLTVRLIIESENGNREIIEKVLHEYGLVIQGESAPEDFFESRIKVIELKSELRIAQARIEMQQDLISHQQLELSRLGDLVHLFLPSIANAQPTQVHVAPVINIHNRQTNAQYVNESISKSIEEIRTLSRFAQNDQKLHEQLSDLENVLAQLNGEASPSTLKKSTYLKKFKCFLDEANQTGTAINTFFSKVSDGATYLQSLARRYNDIAEWCGAPTVPRILLKSES